jgi:hypothetical protein
MKLISADCTYNLHRAYLVHFIDREVLFITRINFFDCFQPLFSCMRLRDVIICMVYDFASLHGNSSIT